MIGIEKVCRLKRCLRDTKSPLKMFSEGDCADSIHRFFIPDFTVGLGIEPNLPKMARGLVVLKPITASEELHLALKQTFFWLLYF